VDTNLASGESRTSNTIFCSSCGNENPLSRGACLICYSYLREEGHGLPCPACAHDNEKEAQFCQACGNPFSAGVRRVPGLVESALTVLQGGVAALTEGEEHEEYEEGFYEEGEEEESLGGVMPESVAAAPVPVAAMEPEESYEADDAMGMPPSALDLQEEPAAVTAEFVPPPPLEEEEEVYAPPPPPGLIEEGEEFTAPPAMMAEEDDDEVRPPAPPPMVFGLDEALPEIAAEAPAAAPPPPPPVVEEAPAEPEPVPGEVAPGLVDPLAAASAATEDEDFGDWSLDFAEEDKSS
jgi:hypothetical protein